ncbi:MAG: biotin--[acetyl-CoA-carboxylase] ligase, partial [Bacteroidota bacterium]
MPAPIRHLAEVDSTNLRAMAWVRTGAPHGAVLTADYQSAGRGRHQRAWISARGQNVMLSMILRTAFGNRVGWVPLAAGLAVAETVDAITNEAGTPVQAQVKWPNDVRIGTGKLAGILAESAG